MAEMDLRWLEGEKAVFFFGGPTGSIDAVTFANALVALVETAYAVNEVVYPGDRIEILLEAQADGSFRALVRWARKELPGFLGRGAENLCWGFVAAAITYAVIGDQEPKISVFTEEVIIETGNDRIIVPREVHDNMQNVQRSLEVRSKVNQTFRIMQSDPNIESFGIETPEAAKAFVIPKERFPYIIQRTALPPEQIEKVRPREVHARLIILKAWLNHGRRKWLFEWNGVPISAPVLDEKFLNQLADRDYLIGAGDALDVILTFKQNFVESLGVYENDPHSFVIKEVIKPVPRTIQERL